MAGQFNPELSDLYKFNETNGTIDPADYDEIASLVDQGIRDALEVADDVHQSTPFGRMIEWHAIHMTNILGLNVQNANQLLLSAAAGQQLDAMAQWFQLRRKGAEYTTVRDVTVTGTSDTILGEGLRARTENGDYFVSTSAVTLDGSGNGQVTFRAVNPGPVPCDKGALRYIDTPVDGWLTVYNDNAGVIGYNIESDDSLRERIANDRATAIGFIGAIKNALDEIAGVRSSMVVENNTGAALEVHGVPMEEHSIFVCVDYDDLPETSQQIAQAIFVNKPCGTGYTDIDGRKTNSTSTTISATGDYKHQVTVKDEYDNPYSVLFFSPIPLAITANVSIVRRSYTGTNLRSDVLTAIQNWFDTELPRVGEPIYATDLIKHIEEQVGGIVVVNCTVSDGGAQSGVSYALVPAYQKATFKKDESIVTDETR